MNIIAAVDKHWAIGNRGKLLVTIPDDQKLFREETKGKVIVIDPGHGGSDVGAIGLTWKTEVYRCRPCLHRLVSADERHDLGRTRRSGDNLLVRIHAEHARWRRFRADQADTCRGGRCRLRVLGHLRDYAHLQAFARNGAALDDRLHSGQTAEPSAVRLAILVHRLAPLDADRWLT